MHRTTYETYKHLLNFDRRYPMDQPTPEETRIIELERRFHFDPKFHDLVAAMASGVESRRTTLDDIQDAVTLLKHVSQRDRAVFQIPRF